MKSESEDAKKAIDIGAESRAVLGVLGMPGSGKSVFAEFLRETGLPVLRLGGFVEQEVIARGLPRDAAGEATVREALRAEEGADVLARRALQAIESDHSQHVFVLDGVYSPIEDELLRNSLASSYFTIAVLANRKLRYERLEQRYHRHLSAEEATRRDLQEVEFLRKADTIALADYFVLNNGDRRSFLKSCIETIANHLSAMGTMPGADDIANTSIADVVNKIEFDDIDDPTTIWLYVARALLEDEPLLTWHVAKLIGKHRAVEGLAFLSSIAAHRDIEVDGMPLDRVVAWSRDRIDPEANLKPPLT